MILAGVDAGATMTRAAAADDAGHVISRAEGGPGNPHNVGAADAAAAIARTLREAAGNRTPEAAVAGVAGIEDPMLKEAVRSALASAGVARGIHLASDAAIALDGAFLGGPGIVVIAGTGSVAWGRDASGKEARAGGWGHLADDAGSGYDVGRAALRVVLRGHDGRGQPTALTPRLLAALRVGRPEEIMGAARVMTPPQIAALAPLVMEVAAQHDALATEIVRDAARELAASAAAVWRALGFSGAHPVAGVGGLFGHAVLRTAFAAALRTLCPEASVVPPRLQPVGGAVWRAFVLSGIEPPGRLIRELAGESAGG